MDNPIADWIRGAVELLQAQRDDLNKRKQDTLSSGLPYIMNEVEQLSLRIRAIDFHIKGIEGYDLRTIDVVTKPRDEAATFTPHDLFRKHKDTGSFFDGKYEHIYHKGKLVKALDMAAIYGDASNAE